MYDLHYDLFWYYTSGCTSWGIIGTYHNCSVPSSIKNYKRKIVIKSITSYLIFSVIIPSITKWVPALMWPASFVLVPSFIWVHTFNCIVGCRNANFEGFKYLIARRKLIRLLYYWRHFHENSIIPTITAYNIKTNVFDFITKWSEEPKIMIMWKVVV